MSLQNFQKPVLSVDQQLGLLAKRGLLIPDHEFALHCLKTVSYYRLSVYCKPYQNRVHNFKMNTSFNMIWELYSFDRELRLLFTDAIERIEVALRTAISNCMSTTYDRLWYLKKPLFKDDVYSKGKFHANLLKNIQEIYKNPKEDFLQHFYNKYKDEFPPSWMIFECLSFGTLSLIFKNLKHMKDKNNIARTLGYHSTILESWIESLVFTRNICAHHSRLWNRWFLFRPKLPSNFGKLATTSDHTIYEQLVVIVLLLNNICPSSAWTERLYSLIEKYTSIPKATMGFANEWHYDRLWQLAKKGTISQRQRGVTLPVV